MADWVSSLTERVKTRIETEKLLRKHLNSSFESLVSVIEKYAEEVNSEIYHEKVIRVTIDATMNQDKEFKYTDEVRRYRLKVIHKKESELEIGWDRHYISIEHPPYRHHFRMSVSESGKILFENTTYEQIAQLLIQPLVEEDFQLEGWVPK